MRLQFRTTLRHRLIGLSCALLVLTVLPAATQPSARAETAGPAAATATVSPVRGAQFSKEIKLALKPVGRLITALRMRMERETPLEEAEDLLRDTAQMMEQQIVYVAVVDPFGMIKLASHNQHPDYGDKRLHRMIELNVNISLKMMRERKTETWLTNRPGHPGHYEILVAPMIKGKFKDHMIYYCVNLGEVCTRAERAMKIQPNEAYYLLSRKGHLIHSVLDVAGRPEDNLTKAEKEYLQLLQNQFLRKDFGVTSYVGFARGNAEVVSHQIGWEKVARSIRDDWVLVFEEKLVVPPQPNRLLLGSWTSTDPNIPLKLGILQEKSKIYLRGDGFAGKFRGEGRFARQALGVTSWFQEENPGVEIISFDATYLARQDIIEAILHWERDRSVQTRKVQLKRLGKSTELAPISVPLEFAPFPNPEARVVP